MRRTCSSASYGCSSCFPPPTWYVFQRGPVRLYMMITNRLGFAHSGQSHVSRAKRAHGGWLPLYSREHVNVVVHIPTHTQPTDNSPMALGGLGIGSLFSNLRGQSIIVAFRSAFLVQTIPIIDLERWFINPMYHLFFLLLFLIILARSKRAAYPGGSPIWNRQESIFSAFQIQCWSPCQSPSINFSIRMLSFSGYPLFWSIGIDASPFASGELS